MREVAQNTRYYAGDRPVYYTEWNSSSNPFDPLHDEPYAAAFAASTVLEAHGLVDGYSFWTFSDIFEENYFPSVPFHGGFGLLNLHGIPKPTYRAFELLHQLGDRYSLVDGLHETVDCSVVQKESSVTVLLRITRRPVIRSKRKTYTFVWTTLVNRLRRASNASMKITRIRNACGRRWANRSISVARTWSDWKRRHKS